MSENEQQAWKEVSVVCDGAKADELSEIMFGLGALSVTLVDAKDDPILEPRPGEERVWPTTVVVGLFEQGADTDPVVSYLQHVYGDQYPIAAHDLEDRDWVRVWMENFKPIKCGERLWICPSWSKIEDENAVTVMLDPGLAFGTGTHPTTFLCLNFLDSIKDIKDKEILD